MLPTSVGRLDAERRIEILTEREDPRTLQAKNVLAGGLQLVTDVVGGLRMKRVTDLVGGLWMNGATEDLV